MCPPKLVYGSDGRAGHYGSATLIVGTIVIVAAEWIFIGADDPPAVWVCDTTTPPLLEMVTELSASGFTAVLIIVTRQNFQV